MYQVAAELGLDEAGRGPMLGPLVLAAVALSEDAIERLRVLGVRDSKCYGAGEKAHAQRQNLVKEVKRCALFVGVEVVPVSEVDAAVFLGELNVLERSVAARLLGRAPLAERVVADGKRVFSALAPRCSRGGEFLAVDRAESLYVSVAAASLCAKVVRDEHWFAIRNRYASEFPEELSGHAGGGYVTGATRRFLRSYVQKHGRLPEETRMSWPRDFLADLLPGHETKHKDGQRTQMDVQQ